MTNIDAPRPDWIDQPFDPSPSLNENKSSFPPSQDILKPSPLPSSLESMPESSSLIGIQFSPTPHLIPPQALRLGEANREEMLNNTIGSIIEVLEETLLLLSSEQIASKSFIQQAEPPSTKGSLKQFISIILQAMRDLKKVKRQVELDDTDKSQDLRKALSELYSLEIPQMNINKLILMTELINLKNEARDISTGTRVILGEHPEIMLNLMECGVLPPMITGGPYDGMAKRCAEQGIPPYDNPAYAAIAESLPEGWEELSIGELNQVIFQLQASLILSFSETISLEQLALFDALDTLNLSTLLQASNLINSFMQSSNTMNMFLLRMQLENLKKTDMEEDHIILGNHPELLVMLLAINLAPNPYLEEGGGAYFGMAQKLALEHKPPYDKPLYACIASNYPPGWESISVRELDRMTQQLDSAIHIAMNAQDYVRKFPYSKLPYGGLVEPIYSNALTLLASSLFSSPQTLSFPFDLKFVAQPNAEDVAHMLLDSVAIFQSFYWTFHPFQFITPNQMAEHLVNVWSNQQIAHALMQDLFGFQKTSLMERQLMAHALVSYVLVGALAQAYNLPQGSILNVLSSLKERTPSASSYVGIAIAMIANDRQGENQALQATIQALIKQLAQVERELQNSEVLQALLQQMIHQLFQIFASNAEGVQMEHAKKYKPPPTMHLQA